MPKKGVVPPHLRKYLFKKGGGRRRRAGRVRTHRRARRSYTMPRRRGRRRGRGRGSLLNQAVNLGIVALAFSPAIRAATSGVSNPSVAIADMYTAGLYSKGKFDKDKALAAYGPIAAALLLFKLKGMVLRGHPLPI